MNAIYDQLEQVQQMGGLSAAYWDKMMHPIPDAEVVNREVFLLDRAKDKVVLDIGCTGLMSEAISQVVKVHHGIDKGIHPNHIASYYQIDLDQDGWMPQIPGLELIIAGEVIEHLSNAGHFLDLLKQYDCPIILTTPNAFNSKGQYYMGRGLEHVNSDHVAWYSWYTLTNLLERHGWEVDEWYWYNGKPGTAEGMIFVVG